MFDWRGLWARREGATPMHTLRLHPTDPINKDRPSAEGPFLFPVRREKRPVALRLASESIGNVEAALAQVERNFAQLRSLAEDHDRPRAA